MLESNEGQKVLDDFLNEIETQKGLHHPNLIQLFGFVTHADKGNFMIQEYMGKGDLKSFLVSLRKDPEKLKKEGSLLWGKLVTWCLEVSLDIVSFCRIHSPQIQHDDMSGCERHGET